jgi:hypothetical protein
MAPTRFFHELSTCQYVEFYRSAFQTSLLYITMDKLDGLIAEVMDDKKAPNQQQRRRVNRKPR